MQWKVVYSREVCFLKLTADSVREVNAQRDKDGIQYARKAMIMTACH